jgi:hypothetical protein
MEGLRRWLIASIMSFQELGLGTVLIDPYRTIDFLDKLGGGDLVVSGPRHSISLCPPRYLQRRSRNKRKKKN